MPLVPFPISHKSARHYRRRRKERERGKTGDTDQDLLAQNDPFPPRIHPILIIDSLDIILRLTPQERLRIPHGVFIALLRSADHILRADE